MSRYIDADAELERLPDDLPYKGSVKRVLIQATAVDAVEVVRCKDCRYYGKSDFDGEILYGCEANGGLLDCDPNSFCSYGERREENAEKL